MRPPSWQPRHPGRWASGLVAATVIVASGACAGAGNDLASFRPGDPTVPPRFTALPPVEELVGAGIRPTEELRFGWLLAQESLALDAPQLPQSRAAADIFAWSEQELAEWLEHKHRTVEAARKELDAAAEQSHPQRILAGALVGLLYEDVSRTLLDVPAPRELDREPEILSMYQRVRGAEASPFLEHARRAYRACAANAISDRRFDAWHHYCAARAERLPEPLYRRPQGNGETEVTVTRELE